MKKNRLYPIDTYSNPKVRNSIISEKCDSVENNLKRRRKNKQAISEEFAEKHWSKLNIKYDR